MKQIILMLLLIPHLLFAHQDNHLIMTVKLSKEDMDVAPHLRKLINDVKKVKYDSKFSMIVAMPMNLEIKKQHNFDNRIVNNLTNISKAFVQSSVKA